MSIILNGYVVMGDMKLNISTLHLHVHIRRACGDRVWKAKSLETNTKRRTSLRRQRAT